LEDLLMALTGKKRVFADAVLAGLSNKDAAIAAGYSAKTAAAAGSRLVKDVDIAAYLAEQKKFVNARDTDKSVSAGSAPVEQSDRPAFDLEALVHFSDPKAFLKAVMNEPKADMRQRVDAAKALMPFEHPKLGEGGKKEQKQAAAEGVSGGRFGLRSVK
jgi:phage terminase small subunit